jgi:hypothetical protein
MLQAKHLLVDHPRARRFGLPTSFKDRNLNLGKADIWRMSD